MTIPLSVCVTTQCTPMYDIPLASNRTTHAMHACITSTSYKPLWFSSSRKLTVNMLAICLHLSSPCKPECERACASVYTSHPLHTSAPLTWGVAEGPAAASNTADKAAESVSSDASVTEGPLAPALASPLTGAGGVAVPDAGPLRLGCWVVCVPVFFFFKGGCAGSWSTAPVVACGAALSSHLSVWLEGCSESKMEVSGRDAAV